MPETLTPKQAFEKLYHRPLSEKEVFEMRENLVGFFELLKKIDKRNRTKSGQKIEHNNCSITGENKTENNKEITKEL